MGYKILEWLQGKKTIIIGILSTVNTYLISMKVLTPELGALIQSILALIGGGAVALTTRAQKLGKIK